MEQVIGKLVSGSEIGWSGVGDRLVHGVGDRLVSGVGDRLVSGVEDRLVSIWGRR